MSTMLASGIPLTEATETLLEDSKGNQQKVLKIINEDLSQGKRLFDALEKFPTIFDKVTTNVIKASEESGTLDTTLKQIVVNLQKEAEFSGKIKSALYYPVFIMIVFIGMILMILTFVVPKIAMVFTNLRIELPLPTTIMIYISDLILKYTIPTAVVTLVLVMFSIFLFRTQKKMITEFVFSLPLIRRLIIKIDLVRMTRNLSSLLESGITITNALELIEDIVVNKEVRKMITNSKEMVLSGRSLSSGMVNSKKIVPSLVVRIIQSGERSGSLEKSLAEVAEYLDYEVSGGLKVLTVLMEPVMLVLVGLMVGGMMISFIAPIYGLIGQVGSM